LLSSKEFDKFEILWKNNFAIKGTLHKMMEIQVRSWAEMIVRSINGSTGKNSYFLLES
jgi:hypothetical protein